MKSHFSLSLVCALFSIRVCGAQCEQQKLIASSPFAAYFGVALDFEGEFTVIGAPSEYVGEELYLGAAYVFRLQGDTWVEHTRLISDDLISPDGDFFGFDVAIQGTTILVGSIYDGHTDHRGAVFMFEFDGTQWSQAAKLKASTSTIGAAFGWALSFEGDRMLVGAPADDIGTGATFVFERSGSIWSEVAILKASDGQDDDRFGSSVALNGDLAFVSSNGTSDAGAVYVYDRTQGWAEVAKLVPADSQPSAYFGNSIFAQGSSLVVGAYRDSNLVNWAGSVYVYSGGGGNWQQDGKILMPDPRADANFGGSVAMQGDTILVGAGGDQPGGSVYVFRKIAGNWTYQAKLRMEGGVNYGLGTDIAMASEMVLAGAPTGQNSNGSEGAVYEFQLPAAVSFYCFGVGCPCNNDDPVKGCGNSVGWNGSNDPLGALLRACGSGSVGVDDLVLTLERVPQNQFGLFYLGGGAVEAPFGDGLRCVGAGGEGVFRFNPPQSSGSAGVLNLGPGIVARSQLFPANGHIDAGETWYFQGWYRDPMGPCGTAFNLSNGLAVTFAP